MRAISLWNLMMLTRLWREHWGYKSMFITASPFENTLEMQESLKTLPAPYANKSPIARGALLVAR
jgi:hypothetical protein